jgi:hypothetical protein
LIGSADPYWDRTLVAINPSIMLIGHGTEGPQDKGAELPRWGLSQPLRLVDSPVLNSKVRHGEHLARLLFHLPCQPILCDCDRYSRLVAGDAVAT